MFSNSKKYFLVLFVLYCLVRVPLLFSNQLLSDELDIGAIANELITKAPHLPISLLDYQKRPYAVTSLLDAAFAVPFFLLFGSTLFSLKLASLTWYIFPLIAWWYVWRETFSPKKTFYILLFFVLSPVMVFYSLTYGHQHMETMLWTALALILYRQFLRGKLGGEIVGGLYLGLFGGLICSLSLANGVALALLCLHLLFFKETKIRKPVFFGVAIPAFLIGVSPLIVYQLKYSMTGYSSMREIFTWIHFSWGHFLQRFVWVFSHGIPGLFVFQKFPPLPKFILTGFFTFSYLSSLIYLVWEKRKSLLNFQGDKGFDVQAFGVTYQLLFIALALVSGRIYGKELFLPIVPFIGMTLVLGASRFLKNKFRTSLALFCITAWILGDLSLVRFKKLGEAFQIQGYSYMLLTQQIACRSQNPKKLEIFLENRSAEEKRRLAFVTLSCLSPEQTSIDMVTNPSLCVQASLPLKQSCYERLGREMVWKWLGTSFQPAAIINQLEREEWDWFDDTALVDFATSLSREEKQWLHQGIEGESSLLIEDPFSRGKVIKLATNILR
ncbi:MAG: hypothetical protein A3F82_02015 [Deltaproteobacteria bacterium RIFCSPLOWO2_12_FULL_44_12]|nr:MAG: hypothetical protein A2712_02940 [Deltaproteobacteria bacterium RIFCSPHIGHO2_01_FULL_43_49]OGQ16151.1 MAG: hypothetical protein A3D22_00910 [Deltaproteobacteria bacterium RIFCSPHIGHO2_02_FULL_44_53]OGQ29112.1 MAG: hypothetical protein A3D98_04695 [Deltaproteobacteria bacterium RIFCSPHIGHO2_12_FULL_44_21]OGQ32668.1 MAG: hypothetical protein A2979_08840 [Deltaproteobacteria bacterium RIFCSPLOWO2_01_FULL_45_74]OGQ41769.1 MAG: hypothetical protein A3I70_08625 [Deltaproteobacteria bacterium 